MKNWLKKHLILISCYLIIVIPAVIFHRPIEIINVLSKTPVDFVEMNISPIRIILEPFLGPIFYFARGHLVLREHFMLLIWGITFFFLGTAITFWRRQLQLGRYFRVSHFLFRKLALLPFIFLFLLTLLAFECFVPLPTNTIKSIETDKILLDLHCHTGYSHNGLISQRGQIDWHVRNGFQATFFTDHNCLQPTLQFIRQRENRKPANNDLVILPGEEFSGASHLLLLNIDSTLTARHFSDETAIQYVKQNGGLVFVAHWWSQHKFSIQQYIDWDVDGFEIAKQGQEIDYNRNDYQDIVTGCRDYNRLVLGTSDYHGYGSFCYSWTAMTIPGWNKMDYFQKKEAILLMLKKRDQRNIQVLAYSDRPVLSESLLFLSPAIHLINYFRTLNFAQILAWFSWILLLTLTGKFIPTQKIKNIFSKNELLQMGIFSLLPSLFILCLGFHFLNQAPLYSGYNEIYQEFGSTFRNSGIGFTGYTLLILGWGFYLKIKQQRFLRK